MPRIRRNENGSSNLIRTFQIIFQDTNHELKMKTLNIVTPYMRSVPHILDACLPRNCLMDNN